MGGHRIKKYSPEYKHFIKQLRKGLPVTFTFVWDLHFAPSCIGINGGATCEDCLQYIEGQCPGNGIPEECMGKLTDDLNKKNPVGVPMKNVDNSGK